MAMSSWWRNFHHGGPWYIESSLPSNRIFSCCDDTVYFLPIVFFDKSGEFFVGQHLGVGRFLRIFDAIGIFAVLLGYESVISLHQYFIA